MALIARPTKTGGSTDFVDGNIGLAAEFNGDANGIYADYNGNITDANIAANAAIQGSKLADSPNGVPAAKINDGAISTTAKIVDQVVTLNKIKGTTHTASRGGGQLPANISNGNFAQYDTGITATRKPLTNYIQDASTLGGLAFLMRSCIFNTGTNTYWVILRNAYGSTINISTTESLLYIFVDV